MIVMTVPGAQMRSGIGWRVMCFRVYGNAEVQTHCGGRVLMIERLVGFALAQRLMVCVAGMALLLADCTRFTFSMWLPIPILRLR